MTAPSLVTVTAYGRGAGSARVRVFDWVDHLGIDARSISYLDTSRLDAHTLLASPAAVMHAEAQLRQASNARSESPLLLSRQASPFSNGGIERALLSRSARGIYDFDDALFAHPVSSRERLWSKRKTWGAAVRSADLVIAGNDYLAGAAEGFAREIVVIPSCVDPDAYLWKDDYTLSGPPRAVWLGSPSTEHYLTLISAPLLELNRTRGLRLTIISAGAAPLGNLSGMVDRVQWSPERATFSMAAADVGIMPLDDTSWSRGKCAYKLLQYGACGLPMVGSPVGANSDFLRAAGAPAPGSAEEWVGALEEVLDAPASARESAGHRAKAVVRDLYSFQAWAPTWRSAVGLT